MHRTHEHEPAVDAPSEGRELTLYTRPQCGLCDAMKRALEAAQREERFVWSERNVDGDPALERAYGTRVPVLAAGARVLVEGRASSREVLVALRGGEAGP